VKATFLGKVELAGYYWRGARRLCSLVLAAVLFAVKKTTVAALFALSSILFIYMRYWSFYFLAIALLMRTRQMKGESGELNTGFALASSLLPGWRLAVACARISRTKARR